MTCEAIRDSHGTSYHVPASEVVRTPAGRVLQGLPAVEVWWSRDFKCVNEETLVIRQEYLDRQTADVVELTLGQAYDLIEALTKAVEHS